MKFFITFIEIITSPFTCLLKKASGKNPLLPLGKVLIVAIISILIVTGLILLVYQNYIFK